MKITSVNELRFQLFTTRKAKAPAIKNLPPTDEALEHHLMRAHLQTMIWRAADKQGPPAVSFEINNFGWKVSDGIPHQITTLANIAPYELMQVVSCTCKVNNPCSRKNCSCAAAAVSCTNYCKCRADTQCQNAHSNNDDDADNDDDAEIEDDSSESDDESDAQDLL